MLLLKKLEKFKFMLNTHGNPRYVPLICSKFRHDVSNTVGIKKVWRPVSKVAASSEKEQSQKVQEAQNVHVGQDSQEDDSYERGNLSGSEQGVQIQGSKLPPAKMCHEEKADSSTSKVNSQLSSS